MPRVVVQATMNGDPVTWLLAVFLWVSFGCAMTVSVAAIMSMLR
jgi:hypothetical protein